MTGKIERRRSWTGTGMQGTPEHIEELEQRRSIHERLIAGKPARPFSAILADKISAARATPEPEPEAESRGAREPHVGLSPAQDPELAQSKGRRKVIVKG